MSILITIDSILELTVVRWLLLITTVVAVATATWCKVQIGTVRLQRDAAKGQAATYEAHLSIQNESIRQAGKDSAAQHKKIADATSKAESMRISLEKWRKEYGKIVLVGNCDEMVDQVIEAVQQ